MTGIGHKHCAKTLGVTLESDQSALEPWPTTHYSGILVGFGVLWTWSFSFAQSGIESLSCRAVGVIVGQLHTQHCSWHSWILSSLFGFHLSYSDGEESRNLFLRHHLIYQTRQEHVRFPCVQEWKPKYVFHIKTGISGIPHQPYPQQPCSQVLATLTWECALM